MLELLARGLRNVEIGRCLYVSPSTVKSELSRLFAKVGVDNRVQAAGYAVRHGVVADPTEPGPEVRPGDEVVVARPLRHM